MALIPFYRRARTYPETLPREEITIVSPPQMPAGGKNNGLVMTIVLGVVGSAGSLVFGLFNKNPMMTFVAIGMVGLTVLTSFLQWWFTIKQANDQRRDNKKKYLAYLEQQNVKIGKIVEKQQNFYKTLFPEQHQLLPVVEKRERVWERNRLDDDFLLAAIGRGDVGLCCRLKLEENSSPFIDLDTELQAKAQALVAHYEKLQHAPLTVPLKTLSTLAIRGKRRQAHELVRSLLTQAAVFHAPEDLQMMVYFHPEEAPEWQWFKWLPHARRARGPKKAGQPVSIRYLADNPGDFLNMFNEAIVPKLRKWKKMREESGGFSLRSNPVGTPDPHHILVIDGLDLNQLIGQSTEFAELLVNAAEVGVTILSVADVRVQIPPSFYARILITEDGRFSFEEMVYGGHRAEGTHVEQLDVTQAEQIARGLAPLVQSDNQQAISLADTVKLLDLMGTPSAAHLQPAQTWKEKPREMVLRAPIGSRQDGQTVWVDLKEAADGGMGPHGLVIGATGSGKSELLRTLVTGLAVNNDPEMVNFIFVDFKGGAAFADLSNLPHCAGMITNLEGDGSMIDRFYQSLLGEMERRQRMLRDAGNLDNVKQYQIKRQSRPFMKPLPYLVLIIDEFGELLQAQPDFTDLFVKIGRIGRSIGIHLLFATQRLEEGRLKGLETHLRYRICLRTFSEQESKAVIDTPDAFYLPSFPGVGYFKVDTHIYDLFKTASISMPFVQGEEKAAGPVLHEFNSTGKLIDLLPPADQKTGTGSGASHTEMEVVIGGLVRQAQTTQPDVHQVWLQPMPQQMTLAELFQAPEHMQTLFETGNYPYFDGEVWPTRPANKLLRVPVGLIDKPLIQAQEPFLLDFAGTEGHLVIVGAPQSGKSMMLRTIISAFVHTHKPTDVQFYVLDQGGGTLRALEGAPHVGAVYGKGDRDKFEQMVRQVHGLMAEREKYFLDHGIDMMSTYRARRTAGELPDAPYGDVFLVIDDIAPLASEFFDLVDMELAEIAATGLNYGIHLILTSNRWVDVRAKLRDNIAGRIELRLNDPADSDFSKAIQQSLPRDVPGRAVIKEGLQVHICLPHPDLEAVETAFPVQRALETFADVARRAWTGQAAPPIRILPPLAKAEQAPVLADHKGVPICIEDSKLDYVTYDLMGSDPHFLLFGDSEAGKTNFLKMLLHQLTRRYTPDEVKFLVVDYRRTMHELVNRPEYESYLHSYIWNANMANDALMNFRFELDARMPNAFSPQGMEMSWTGPHYVLLTDDFDMVSASGMNPLGALTDLLLQARDIGFHSVTARRVGGSSRSFDQFLQRLKEMNAPGIVLSGDTTEGPVLGMQRAFTLPPGRGYLVRRNHKNQMVQTLYLAEEAVSTS
jgi:S-DNA-T family DNA segregation ATPase FtsK/SpoIIIE